MNTLEDAFEMDSVFVFGIGGSGDIVGSIPTARLLEMHGVDVLLGGVAWEPVPYDTQVGPRSLDEVENLDRISDRVGIATSDTQTQDDVRFKEAIVAEYFDCETALVDITGGIDKMVSSIEQVCDLRGFDAVIGVDVGSDVLAKGDEPGLRSPLTDFYGLVTLDELAVETCLGVFGYGSDGELTRDELEAGIGRAAQADGLLGAWGLTRRVRTELEGVLDVVETQASRLPVQAARGELGERQIRGGEVELQLSPPSVVTFYFDPSTIASSSRIASILRETHSFDESITALHDAGIQTEFDIGRDRLDSF
jgi:hypothetical protein